MNKLSILALTASFLVNQLTGYSQVTNKPAPCAFNCPSNMIVRSDKGQEGAIVTFAGITADGDCGEISYSPASGSFFRLGSHSVIATSSTGQKCSFTVTVTDNEPPYLSAITISKEMLWPATGKMKKVGVYYSISDNGQNAKASLSVVSNNGNNSNDWEIVDDHLLRLKASRLPDGSPRIYFITVTVTDDAGNKTTRTTSIAVSKTMIAVEAK